MKARRPGSGGQDAAGAGADSPEDRLQVEHQTAPTKQRGHAHLWVVRPDCGDLGSAGLLLALVCDAELYLDPPSRAASQFRVHRNSILGWRACLLGLRLVAWEGRGLVATDLARRRLERSDPLPRPLLWQAPPATRPVHLRAAAVLYGEVVGPRASRPGVRGDSERAELADVDRAAFPLARRMLEELGLVRFEKVQRGRLRLWRGTAIVDHNGNPLGSYGGSRRAAVASPAAQPASAVASPTAQPASAVGSPAAQPASAVASPTAQPASVVGSTAQPTSAVGTRLHNQPAGRVHSQPAAPCSPLRDYSHSSRARHDGSHTDRIDGWMAGAGQALATIDPRADVARLGAAKSARGRRRGGAEEALAELRRLAADAPGTLHWLATEAAGRGRARAVELLLQRLVVWDQSPTKRRQLAGEVARVLKPEDALAAAADCVLSGARDLPAMLRRRLEAACQRPDAARTKARWDWPLGRLLEAVATYVAPDAGKACQEPGSAAPADGLVHATPNATVSLGDSVAVAGAIDCERRRLIVARLFGDRHQVSRVATELGIEESLIEQIKREEQAERDRRAANPASADLLAPSRRKPPTFLERRGAS